MTVVAAAAAAFGRDLDFCLQRIATLIEHSRQAGAALLVLPDAALGGYLADIRSPDLAALPPALDPDSPYLRKVSALAAGLVVCLGYCEAGPAAADGAAGPRYNAAVCVTGDGVLGRHRKVHQPPGETGVYAAGESFAAFDTPAGRVGMLIDYDKTFPEAARALALDGAQIVACLSAWPAARTNPAPDLAQDRWTRRFDLFDRARALENQLLWVSANQSGTFGELRFVASAKVVDAGGDVLATTGTEAGVAYATVDLDAMMATARRVQHHLSERKPGAYW